MNEKTRDKHSVNCYHCTKEIDEREGYPADPFNNDNGGTLCYDCVKGLQEFFLAKFALSYIISNADDEIVAEKFEELGIDEDFVQNLYDEMEENSK
jgi:FMN phosphatase YigB (HAD superfamily)